MNYGEEFIHGPNNRLILENPNNVGLHNTIFNTRSGNIIIGDGVIFGHNCMVLTGTHNYKSFDTKKIWEVPKKGRDIYIGKGTMISSGSIILGKVKIGKYCVIAAGSIVNNDIPDYSFVCGKLAEVKGDVRDMF